MKTLFSLLTLTLGLSSGLLAQKASCSHTFEADGFYNWSFTGNSISLLATQSFGRHAISFGAKIHDNTPITDNRGYAHYRRFNAEKKHETLGLNLGYRFDIRKTDAAVNPYAFYLLQVSRLRLITDYEAHFEIISQTDPIVVFDHTVGVGLQVELVKNLYLNQSFGVGMAQLDSPYASFNRVSHDYFVSGRLGLTYRFSSSEDVD
jgi:hypothetical protein